MILVENLKEHNKTNLGFFCKDWKLEKFGNLYDNLSTGMTPSRKYPEYFKGNILWVTSGELNYSTIYDTKEKITSEAQKKTRLKIYPKGTFFIAITGLEAAGTRGKCAILGKEGTTNQSCMAFPKHEEIFTPFLFHFYCLFGEKIALKLAQGTKQQSLNSKIVKGIKIPVPPLLEQKKIAQILSTWDNAIEKTKQLIEHKNLLMKGLMQQLLTGKVRFNEFKSEEWQTIELGDVITRTRRKNEQGHDNVVTISAQRGFVKQETFFNKRVASDTLTNYYLVKRGEFAYNKSYSKGYPMGAFKRLDDFDFGVVTTLYICFAINEGFDSDFFLHFFEAGMMIKGLSKIAQEGGRAHGLLNISLGDFMKLKLTIPSPQEQQKIASVLNSYDKDILKHESYLEKLQEQKKGLMQQLLTGATRVKL